MTATTAEHDASLPTTDEAALTIKDFDQRILHRVVNVERSLPAVVPMAEELRQWLVADNAPFTTRPYDLFERKLMSENQKKELEKTAKALGEFEKHPQAPARAMALGEGDPQNGKVCGFPRT